MYVCMYVCVYVRREIMEIKLLKVETMYVCMCVYMYVCMYVCMYVGRYVCM